MVGLKIWFLVPPFKNRRLDFSAWSADCKSQEISAGCWNLPPFTRSTRHHDHGVLSQDLPVRKHKTAAAAAPAPGAGHRSNQSLNFSPDANGTSCFRQLLLYKVIEKSHIGQLRPQVNEGQLFGAVYIDMKWISGLALGHEGGGQRG